MNLPASETGYYIGIDLGGFGVKVALSNGDGELLVKDSIETESEKGPEHVVKGIADMVARLTETAGITQTAVLGVGIGAPGPLDTKSGVIINAPNLKWMNVPFREMVSRQLGLEAALENDANAAALGEWWKGAGKGTSSLVCITLGTGVGGGIVFNGEIWHGATGVAGELGHMTIVVDGRQCGCGRYGCLEAYASATAISARAAEGLEKGQESSLKAAVSDDLRKITSKIVYQQAVAGDTFCKEIMTETSRYLAVGVANILNILNPEAVVLAGGVIQAGELLFEPLLEEVKLRIFPMAADRISVVPAELGTDAGVIGAVGVIKNFMEGSLVH
jgi:glucokinase